MADLLNIGLSALLAQQRALTTTANNIANASTPGYSRQRVELTERHGGAPRPDFVGTGVDVALTRRMSDDLLAEQLRTAAGGFHRADAFVALAESLDDMLAGTETGLTATMQAFIERAAGRRERSVVDRRAGRRCSSEARNLVARFDAMDQRLTELERRGAHAHDGDCRRDHRDRRGSWPRSTGSSSPPARRRAGRAPSDLLDQRDRLLEELSGLVQVTAAQQRDGTTHACSSARVRCSCSAANCRAARVTPGNADPLQPQIVIRGIGPDVNVTQFVTGGELGGVARFQSRDARAGALGARPHRGRPRRAPSMPCTATAWTRRASSAAISSRSVRRRRFPRAANTGTGVACGDDHGRRRARADELSADVRRHGLHAAARRQRRRRADDRCRHDLESVRGERPQHRRVGHAGHERSVPT